jgi:hypothetical protein
MIKLKDLLTEKFKVDDRVVTPNGPAIITAARVVKGRQMYRIKLDKPIPDGTRRVLFWHPEYALKKE